MAGQEDFYSGEDLKAILEAIEDDLWNNDPELSEEVDRLINQIELEPAISGFSCEECGKICKSKQGLSRHRNCK